MNTFTCTCAHCDSEFAVPHAWQARLRKYCSRGCAARSQRLATTKAIYRSAYVGRNHPLSNGQRMIHEHRLVLWNKIGPGSHPCHYCGKSVTWMPGAGCQLCNTKNGCRYIQDSEASIMLNGRRRRLTTRECLHCGKTFQRALSPSQPGKYCSRSCNCKSRAGRGKTT